MNMEIAMLMWFSGISPDNMRPAPHPDGNYSPSTYNCGRAFIREGNYSDSGTRAHAGCKGRLFFFEFRHRTGVYGHMFYRV